MENTPKPTDAQIAEMEAKMQAHFEKKLPFLRIHAEYEMLQADIAEARIRQLAATHQFIQAQQEQAKANAGGKEGA